MSSDARDFPPNSITKPGYTLEFHDEFTTPDVTPNRWIPYHLPQWSTRARAEARRGHEDGHLALRIDADQPPWCPEYDGGVRVSSLQTGVHAGPVGSTLGQHRFNPRSVVREAQVNRITCAPTHGYIELRARAELTPGNHAALWMIGVEDEPERSAEICICELFGRDAAQGTSVVCFGLHPFADPRIVDDFRAVRLPIDIADFHLYAAEWTPQRVSFFVDNQEVGIIEQSPQYPMQLMLGLYEQPDETPPGGRYPKKFIVDYLRVYRPVGGYR